MSDLRPESRPLPKLVRAFGDYSRARADLIPGSVSSYQLHPNAGGRLQKPKQRDRIAEKAP